MNDYFSGASKLKSSDASLNAKMAVLMGAGGFTQLNTIEEEKHETQTSNYFRDHGHGGPATVHNMTESERDYDNNTNMRGSRILDEDLINSSAKYSPHRLLDGTEFDFPASAKANHGHLSQSLQQRSLDRVSNGGSGVMPKTSKNPKKATELRPHNDVLDQRSSEENMLGRSHL